LEDWQIKYFKSWECMEGTKDMHTTKKGLNPVKIWNPWPLQQKAEAALVLREEIR
jgi:hypothetical protein